MSASRMSTASQTNEWAMSASDVAVTFENNGQLAVGPYFGGYRNSTREVTGFFLMDPNGDSGNGTGYPQAYSCRISGLYRSQDQVRSNPPRPYFRDTGTLQYDVQGPYSATGCTVGPRTGGGNWSSAYMQFSDAEDYEVGEFLTVSGNVGTTTSVNVGFEPSMVMLVGLNWQSLSQANSSATITACEGFLTSGEQACSTVSANTNSAPSRHFTTRDDCCFAMLTASSGAVNQRWGGTITATGFDLELLEASSEPQPTRCIRYLAIKDTRITWGIHTGVSPSTAGISTEDINLGGVPIFGFPIMRGNTSLNSVTTEDWMCHSWGTLDEAGKSRSISASLGEPYDSGVTQDRNVASNRAIRFHRDNSNYWVSMRADTTTPTTSTGYKFEWDVATGGTSFQYIMPYAVETAVVSGGLRSRLVNGKLLGGGLINGGLAR